MNACIDGMFQAYSVCTCSYPFMYTVAHIVEIFFFYPNLWNYFDNDLFLMYLDNSIHSQILLNNNLPVFVLRDCYLKHVYATMLLN